MVVSLKKNFIFIHIYKVAGSSITKSLRMYEPNSVKFKRIVFAWPLTFIAKRIGILDHEKELSLDFFNYKQIKIHATALNIRKIIGKNSYEKLFKFAFVRNPWDWQVSLYHYALQNQNHPQHQLFKSFKDFDAYINWRINNQLKLQKDFLTDENGNIIVDYIGKFETIQKDINYLSNKLKIDIHLPHINRTKRRHYSDYYTKKTFDWVYESFEEDIKMFGYEPS